MAQMNSAVDIVETPIEPGSETIRNYNATSRPECFSSTLQECLFVLTATMCNGMSSFLYGVCTVITAQIGQDLNMTIAQITWISASSS